MSAPAASRADDLHVSAKGFEPWAFDPRRVDKPWGHELIWALSEVYCGKLLFVKAGHSLSLQLHREKDESWLVQSGRAKVELGHEGDAALVENVVEPGEAFHYVPGTVTELPWTGHAPSHSGYAARCSAALRSSFGVFTVSHRPSWR